MYLEANIIIGYFEDFWELQTILNLIALESTEELNGNPGIWGKLAFAVYSFVVHHVWCMRSQLTCECRMH